MTTAAPRKPRRKRHTLKVTKPNPRELRIERKFDASREHLWRAITKPECVAEWWGRGNKVDIEKMEMNRGGHWRFVEHAPDGPQGFEGRVREVVPQEKIVRTFEWDGEPGMTALETMTLEDTEDGHSKIVSTLQMYTKEQRDGMLNAGMKDGMRKSYAELDKVLVKMHSAE